MSSPNFITFVVKVAVSYRRNALCHVLSSLSFRMLPSGRPPPQKKHLAPSLRLVLQREGKYE